MWSSGEVVLRREVRNDGFVWAQFPVVVVRDEPGLLATYVGSGTPFEFPPGPEAHPWSSRAAWEGNGMLMLQRPGEAYAVFVFWFGPDREFRGWYVNFQEPFRRTLRGYDTQDLELDIWVPLDGAWEWKDRDMLEQRVREGRFTPEQGAAVLAEGERVGALLDAGECWWDDAWASWSPEAGWDRT